MQKQKQQTKERQRQKKSNMDSFEIIFGVQDFFLT